MFECLFLGGRSVMVSPVMPEPTNLPLPHLHGQGQSYRPYLHSEGRLVQPWPSVEPIVAFPEEEELFNEVNKVTLFWFREWPLRIEGGRHHWCKALEAKGERVIHLLTKRDKTLKIDSNHYRWSWSWMLAATTPQSEIHMLTLLMSTQILNCFIAFPKC